VEEKDKISLYRAVSSEEFYSIIALSKFTIPDGGVDAKYFGLNFEETLVFANDNFNNGIVAIFEVTITKKIIEDIGDFTHVDSFIFKSGTVIISAEDLEVFNNSIQELIHKY
jgi:hypothetical protein